MRSAGLPAPSSWHPWLTSLFPRFVSSTFAKRHAEFWEWVWAIEDGDSPAPFVAIWPRGGAKSSSAELAAAALGVRGKRRYAWYVRQTQELADGSVQNVGSLLEDRSVERHYPEHAERKVGKYGDPRGWRRNRLRTQGGFTIDALGLDTAARGLKVDEDRPDFIILDDIDDKHDSLATTAKKIATITTSLLPAGARHVAVLAIQNLIIADGFFTRMADGRADYLTNRLVSGPHPAVRDLKTDVEEDGETGARRAVIVGGKATWAGQDLRACQHMMDTIGLAAFLKECQHEVQSRKEGRALRFADEHLEDLTDAKAQEMVQRAARSGTMGLWAGIDFGAWRFGCVFRASDKSGRAHEIAEYFSQRGDSLEHRAKAIDAIGKHYGYPAGFAIWGDAANPTDILEINLAFQRIGSSYRVVPVAMENKMRKASVDRLNDLLDRHAITYRRDVVQATAAILALVFKRPVGDFLTWQLGWNASGAGVQMTGSRLKWEVEHWGYPIPKEGEPQEQDPDDATADGADMVAGDRYGIMSWWTATHDPVSLRRGEDIDQTRIEGGQVARTNDRAWQQFDREQQAAMAPRHRSFKAPRRNQTRTVQT